MKELKKINWIRILVFYGTILILTYLVRKLPNVLQLLTDKFTGINLTLNYNHGIIIFLISLLFYRVYNVPRLIIFWGDKLNKSILFPLILLVGYSIIGIQNDFGINKHLWALIFCVLMLIYNLMEEFTWRGYLIESLDNLNIFLKAIISGVFWAFWHLLIFSDFKQYGGFGIFLIFCVIFSLILTFSVHRTKSILVPASIHTLLIRTNFMTLICLILYAIILITWNKTFKKQLPIT